MMTSSNGNIFRVTGHLCGEFTGPGDFPAQRPVTWSFDVFFDLSLHKRLSKQSWGWWSETPSSSLWRHRNAAHDSMSITPKALCYYLENLICLYAVWRGYHSGYGLSQWETTWQCNVVSHWLCPYSEWSMCLRKYLRSTCIAVNLILNTLRTR